MATYAIGDIQGCWATLQQLLKRIAFAPETDSLWLTGDLVNRGPNSLEVLRWAYTNQAALAIVLGNHELHLLARARGIRKAHGKDTLEDILNAPDREKLLDWLIQTPLLYRRDNTAMVHAGLLPHWDIRTAEQHARALEQQLQGPHSASLLQAYTNPCPVQQPSTDDPLAHSVYALHALTRLRICTPSGGMRLNFSGTLADIPPKHHAWFHAPNRRWTDHKIIAGHWAALGLHKTDEVISLDTGCVWGGHLTAVCLESGLITQEPCIDTV